MRHVGNQASEAGQERNFNSKNLPSTALKAKPPERTVGPNRHELRAHKAKVHKEMKEKHKKNREARARAEAIARCVPTIEVGSIEYTRLKRAEIFLEILRINNVASWDGFDTCVDLFDKIERGEEITEAPQIRLENDDSGNASASEDSGTN